VARDFALAEVERMIRDGEIKDATTVAAFGLLRLKGLL
jgi:ADP-ribose pyrophosphatase